MLPMLDEQTVLLERQYRYPLRRHFFELPAGKIDPGEEPLETAQRELSEECGYEAASWRRLDHARSRASATPTSASSSTSRAT